MLIAGNWGDYNVKQEGGYNLFTALQESGNKDAHLYFGSRWRGHQAPDAEDFARVKAAWLDRYLKGADTGIESLPPVTSQQADSDGGGDF